MMWHFILAKRQIRYVLNISSKLVKHGTQNPVYKFKMLAFNSHCYSLAPF